MKIDVKKLRDKVLEGEHAVSINGKPYALLVFYQVSHDEIKTLLDVYDAAKKWVIDGKGDGSELTAVMRKAEL